MPTIARKIKEAAFKNKRISFLVETPTSDSGIPVQSVMMKDFVVKRTRNGSTIVQGRDLAKELQQDVLQNRSVASGQHRRKTQTVVRSYRVDRIIPRSLISS